MIKDDYVKTVEDAKKLVTKFIYNIAVFDELSTSIIEQRDAELAEYVSTYVYERVSGMRPYEGVIERIEVFNIDFEDIQNNPTNAIIILSIIFFVLLISTSSLLLHFTFFIFSIYNYSNC